MDLPVLPGLAADGTAVPETARRAARAWHEGGLVALPTETVYGLAADAQDADAVARIYQAKGRPADHPLIVHVADRAAIAAWSAVPDPVAEALAATFWPGPLTLVVQRAARAGDHLTGGQGTVALRCPGHPVALASLRALGELTGDPARGVAAPSANRFGRVSPTSAADVVAELADRLDARRDLVVDGGSCAVGLESTIVDCTATVDGQPRPRVLRPGAISQSQVDTALTRAGLVPAASDRAPFRSPEPGSGPERDDSLTGMGPDRAGDAVRVPGSLDAHYAPAAEVIVLAAGAVGHDLSIGDLAQSLGGAPLLASTVGLIAAAEVATPLGWVRLAAPPTVTQYAHDLYAALRRADELGLARVVAVLPPADQGPLAAALADRLGRAAHR